MAAGNYFKNFGFAEYKFGNNTDIDLSQDLSRPISLT